jgi:hypothetical protein
MTHSLRDVADAFTDRTPDSFRAEGSFFVLPVQLPEHYAIKKEKRAAERYYANQRTRQPSSSTASARSTQPSR